MIRLMVDSSSDLRAGEAPADLFVPITINIGGKEYRDGVELEKDQFYGLLCSEKEFPRTSQPSPELFLQHFGKAQEAGDEVIYLALSSALSGSCQSARIAKEMCGYDGIYIIDTLCASQLIGVLARQVKKLAALGLSAEEIVKSCEELKGRIRIYAGVQSLEYLQKGGRLSKGAAVVGTLAGIKPVLTIDAEGRVVPVGKARGIKRAIGMICELSASHQLDESFPVYSLYSYGVENCVALEDAAKAKGFAVAERLQAGPTIGAHVGPGLYGLIFVEK